MSVGNVNDQPFFPAIRRARLDNLTIYEISEAELNTLEKGSPDSIYLNISIALLSLAFAFLGSMIVTKFESNVVLFLFIVLIVVGFVVGGVLLLLWYKSRSSVSDCIESIKRRLPPEGEVAPIN
jgi:uncharacterized membrane-anchored protein